MKKILSVFLFLTISTLSFSNWHIHNFADSDEGYIENPRIDTEPLKFDDSTTDVIIDYDHNVGIFIYYNGRSRNPVAFDGYIHTVTPSGEEFDFDVVAWNDNGGLKISDAKNFIDLIRENERVFITVIDYEDDETPNYYFVLKRQDLEAKLKKLFPENK